LTQTTRYVSCLGVLGLASLLIPLRLVQVTGTSMQPTLRNGQRLLLDRLYYRVSGLAYDDIVVVQHDGDEIIKRVKGLPGDLLQLEVGQDETAFQVENLTRHPEERGPPIFYRREMRLPASSIYVVGDNRWISEDSRRFGPVSLSSVMGVVRRFNFSRVIPEVKRTRPPFIPGRGPAFYWGPGMPRQRR
jgi:signal peptidase I